LVVILTRQQLLFKKELGTLVNFLRLLQVRRSLLDFSRIEHVLKIIGFSRDSETGSSLLIKSLLLIESELQLDCGDIHERLSAFHVIADIDQNFVDFSLDFRTNRHFLQCKQRPDRVHVPAKFLGLDGYGSHLNAIVSRWSVSPLAGHTATA